MQKRVGANAAVMTIYAPCESKNEHTYTVKVYKDTKVISVMSVIGIL